MDKQFRYNPETGQSEELVFEATFRVTKTAEGKFAVYGVDQDGQADLIDTFDTKGEAVACIGDGMRTFGEFFDSPLGLALFSAAEVALAGN